MERLVDVVTLVLAWPQISIGQIAVSEQKKELREKIAIIKIAHASIFDGRDVFFSEST